MELLLVLKVLVGIILFWSVPLAVFVAAALLKGGRWRNTTHILLINISIANLLTCPLLLHLIYYAQAMHRLQTLGHASIMVSSFTLVSAAVYRYRAIYYPFKQCPNNKYVCGIQFGIWVLCFSVYLLFDEIPNMVGRESEQQIVTSLTINIVFTSIVAPTMFSFISLAIVSVLHVRMAVKLQRQIPCLVEVQALTLRMRENRKALQSLFYLTVSFAVCTLPYAVFMIWYGVLCLRMLDEDDEEAALSENAIKVRESLSVLLACNSLAQLSLCTFRNRFCRRDISVLWSRLVGTKTSSSVSLASLFYKSFRQNTVTTQL